MDWESKNILNYDMETETNNMDNLMILSLDNSLLLNKFNSDEKFFDTFCRLCARSAINSTHIFSELGKSLKLVEKIEYYFQIKVEKTDSLPKQLCNNCVEKINCNDAFEKQCIQAEESLFAILDEEKCSNQEKSFCVDKCLMTLNGQMIAILNNNAGETHQHDTCNHKELSMDLFQPVKHMPEHLEKVVTFQCLGDNQQYIKCNACMNLFRDKISIDNHKCKLLTLNTSFQPYICLRCNVTFSLEEHLNFHQQLHENRNNFQCDICNIAFNNEQKLFHHHKRYHCKSKQVSCFHCGKLFDNQSQVRLHVCIDGKIRQHICEVCNKGFTDGYTLKRHVVTHLPEKPFKCSQCTKSFTQKSRLNKHITDHRIIIEESQVCWRCLECGEIFPDCEEADEHYKCHNNTIRLIEELSIEKIYHCEFCNNLFADLSTLKIHQSKHLAEKSFNCTVCKIEIESFTEAVIHWNSHPRTFNLATVFACDICERDMKELALLYKHRRKRHHFTPKKSVFDERQILYTCELCGNVFEQLDDIINHGALACSKYLCDICGNRLLSANSLEAHKRRHNGLRPYVCDICGKSYTQSSHMWTHKRFHMGIKPYICEYCDKKFTIKPDLADHMRKKHTRERPFKCDVCDKAFLTGSVFYQHRLIHRGDRRYKCNFCEKDFTRTEALNNHVKIHTGEKPHACDICGRCFRQKGDMRKHRRTQHGVEDKLIFNEKIIASLQEIVEIINVR